MMRKAKGKKVAVGLSNEVRQTAPPIIYPGKTKHTNLSYQDYTRLHFQKVRYRFRNGKRNPEMFGGDSKLIHLIEFVPYLTKENLHIVNISDLDWGFSEDNRINGTDCACGCGGRKYRNADIQWPVISVANIPIPHKGKYFVIDGTHRCQVTKDKGIDQLGAFVLEYEEVKHLFHEMTFFF